jgi:ABC-type phosphate transport system substrate-binding protein
MLTSQPERSGRPGTHSKHRDSAPVVSLVVLLTGFWLFWSPIACAAENPLVISHPDVPSDLLAAHSLRAMIAQRQHRWPNGQAVHVFVLPDDHPVHIQFAKAVLGVFPHQLRLAWDRQVFSGTAQAPARVNSERELLERVATTPGAIGYVSKEVANERVRVLQVE